MCALMDSHGSTDVLCVVADTHGRPVCAARQPTHGRSASLSPRTNVLICNIDGHPRTSVCWRDTHGCLCVLNRQPTWRPKSPKQVHRKGQHAGSKDQRADIVLSKDQRVDMCTDGQRACHVLLTDTHGQPDVCVFDGHTRTSCVCWRTPRTRTHGHAQTATNILCVLVDTARTTQMSPDVLCVLADTHGASMCADGHHGRPVYSPVGFKSPNSHGKGKRASTRTNVLICVLMDSHGRLCVLTDTHENTRTATDVIVC
ncbi:unnamed protein product [Brassica rapa]|uniref:Uncharacterized protein n=1 Tax=Brassica campestris TaxID=3711 RepID=A0A8D9G653_BRACM|nr:unnamed protein product [Brassica rapa]